jgi:hypothetical protein
MARPQGLLVGVDPPGIGVVEHAVARHMGGKSHRPKEPVGVCQVSLGRAGVRRRLHPLVFRSQRLGKVQGVLARGGQACARCTHQKSSWVAGAVRHFLYWLATQRQSHGDGAHDALPGDARAHARCNDGHVRRTACHSRSDFRPYARHWRGHRRHQGQHGPLAPKASCLS